MRPALAAPRDQWQDATMNDEIEWKVSDGLVPYPEALAWMEARAAAIAEGSARECIWLLEHPPLYSAGTSADVAELLDDRFPVFKAGRGGRYTYHGPGQRIGYLMIDLNKRGRDVRCFVHAVEGWVIATLSKLGIEARREAGRIGIWTNEPEKNGRPGAEAKIGAIGIRVRRWVSFHGFSVNISPDLSHFGGIIPCGLPDFPVTSVASMDNPATMSAFDSALYEGLAGFLAELK
ncbi:MAG: lipB [Sphingomonadales bacterium]|nr:lipB [Sphingomonadales bacterium]